MEGTIVATPADPVTWFIFSATLSRVVDKYHTMIPGRALVRRPLEIGRHEREEREEGCSMSKPLFPTMRLAAVCFVIELLSAAYEPRTAVAQNRSWHPIPIDTNWLNGENWIPTGVPTAAETALITFNGQYWVSLGTSQEIGGLTLGGLAGTQMLTLENGAVLTIEQGSVRGTGILVLNDATVNGTLSNLATIRLQGGTLSSLLSNSGLVEALESNNVIRNGFLNTGMGTFRVIADGSDTRLTYGEGLSLGLSNAGLIELAGSGGGRATLEVVGGPLTNHQKGIVRLSGGSDTSILDATVVDNRGLFSGQGELTGDLLNQSRLVVGTSLGTLRVGGLYSQSANASAEFEIAGTVAGSQYDLLDVAESANLDGGLYIDFTDGFQPADTDEFTIIHRDGGSGTFDTVQVSGLAGYGFSIGYAEDAVVMNFHQAGVLRGDYNHNGVVEQGDLDLVLLNWGASGRTPVGWINDLPDSFIDQSELDGVLLNWGAAAGGASLGHGVPEPSTWTLLLSLLVLLPLATRTKSRFTST
jgi:hypothetical protein